VFRPGSAAQRRAATLRILLRCGLARTSRYGRSSESLSPSPSPGSIRCGITSQFALKCRHTANTHPGGPLLLVRKRREFFVWSSRSAPALARQRRPRGATQVRLPDLGRVRPSIRCDILSEIPLDRRQEIFKISLHFGYRPHPQNRWPAN
jgi:hypothetical protein